MNDEIQEQRKRIAELEQELASKTEDADVWQEALETIIELTGQTGPSSIAALAVEGVERVMRDLTTIRTACQILSMDVWPRS